MRSRITVASVSTGSHEQRHIALISYHIPSPQNCRERGWGVENRKHAILLTSDNKGNTPNTNELLIIIGKNYPSFRTPSSVSPTSCPILNTYALAPASSTALNTTCSPTNLYLAYPVAETCVQCDCKDSGTTEQAGEFNAMDIDDAKKSCADCGRFTHVDSESRLCRPRMYGSKALSGRLKFTGQAMWMMSAHSRFSKAEVEGSRLKSGPPTHLAYGLQLQ